MAGALIKDYVGAGLVASRPSTPSVVSPASAFYYATDTSTLYVWDNVANTWDTVTGGGGGGSNPWWFVPPTAASFSLASGDATNVTLSDDTQVGLVVNSNTIVSGNKIRYAYKTIPAPGSDWAVVAKLQMSPQQTFLAGSGGGICCVESGTGKSYSFHTIPDGNGTQGRQGTISGTVGFNRGFNTQYDVFVKLARVGSTIQLSLSYDGKNFALGDSITTTSVFTTAPDRVGPCCVLNGGTGNVFVTVPYWTQTF